MNKIFISLISLVLIILFGCQKQIPEKSQVVYLPQKPVQDKTLLIKYTPGKKSTFATADSVVLQALFIPVNPTEREILEKAKMVELNMLKEGSSWQVRLKPDSKTGCIIWQFKSNNKYDNNNNKGWELLIYNKNKKPVKGAYSALSQAIGEGMVSYLMDFKKFNMDSALLYYNKEIKLYPDNWRAKAVSINLRYRKAVKENNQNLINDIKKETDRYVKEHPNDLSILELAYIFYYRPFPKDAEAVLKQIERIDPKNRYVVGLKINKVRKIKDNRIRLKKLLAMKEEVDGTLSYFSWGNLTLESLIALKQWEDVVDLSHHLVKNIESKQFVYPSYTKEKAKKWEQTQLYSPLKALALAYHKIGNDKEAENCYLRLDQLNVYPHQRVTFLEEYIRFLWDTNHREKALNLALESIKKANSSAVIEEMYKKMYAEKTGDLQSAQKMIDKAKQESDVWRKKELAKAMLTNQPHAAAFSMKTLEGKTVSLDKLRGKIVILDFWATWCNPCKASFPYLQKFWEQHQSDPKIALFAVNTKERMKGEKRITAIKKFMREHGYTFPVLLDDPESSNMRAFGVGSIPTKFFIGPKGKIYFKEIGFHGPNMTEDMNIQIQLIKEKARTLF